MVLLILNHSFQSICVPKCCLQREKKGIQEQRVFGVMKAEGMDCVLHAAVRQLEMGEAATREQKNPTT